MNICPITATSFWPKSKSRLGLFEAIQPENFAAKAGKDHAFRVSTEAKRICQRCARYLFKLFTHKYPE